MKNPIIPTPAPSRLNPVMPAARQEGDPRLRFHSTQPHDNRRLLAVGVRLQRVRGRSH